MPRIHPATKLPSAKELQEHGITASLRSFPVKASDVSPYYPYTLPTANDISRVPYREFRGTGPPGDFGLSGDIYFNRKYDSLTLYGRTKNKGDGDRWIKWSGPTPTLDTNVPHLRSHAIARKFNDSLYKHPDGFEMYLWSDGMDISWFSREKILRSRYSLLNRSSLDPRHVGTGGWLLQRVLDTEKMPENAGQNKRKSCNSDDNQVTEQKKPRGRFYIGSPGPANSRGGLVESEKELRPPSHNILSSSTSSGQSQGTSSSNLAKSDSNRTTWAKTLDSLDPLDNSVNMRDRVALVIRQNGTLSRKLELVEILHKLEAEQMKLEIAALKSLREEAENKLKNLEDNIKKSKSKIIDSLHICFPT